MLFGQSSVDRLDVTADRIVALLPDLADAGTCHETARMLERRAPWFERHLLDVQVLGARRPVFHASGAPRCAYCHDAINGAEPDLVACRECSTVLHDGCWSELGRCPVLG